MARERIWIYYKSPCGYGWAIFNNKYKYISHYEQTERDAFRLCMKWNREQKEF